MARKLSIKRSNKIALSIMRSAIRAERLVYIAVANKKIKYQHDRSYIAYIGTTKTGANRIAGSAAARAKELLTEHGIKRLDFFVVTCTAKQRVETWKKLETALLLTFRCIYGTVPLGNTHGKKMKWGDEKKYFTTKALEQTIDKYSRTVASQR